MNSDPLLFGDAMQDIARAVRGAHTDPQEYEFCGVPVLYENDSMFGDTWDEWEEVLDEWMPRLDQAGFLDGLEGIRIGDSYISPPNSGGRYMHEEKLVVFPQSPEYSGQPWLVGETKGYALIHEVTHHHHITEMFDKPAESITTTELNFKQLELGFEITAPLFENEVSEYAATNYLEAVAETCAGITIGREYSDNVLEAYRELGGPEPPTQTYKSSATQ